MSAGNTFDADVPAVLVTEAPGRVTVTTGVNVPAALVADAPGSATVTTGVNVPAVLVTGTPTRVGRGQKALAVDVTAAPGSVMFETPVGVILPAVL